MGDIAEMKLDGTLCECCGCYIEEGEAQGFPRRCKDCGEITTMKRVKKAKTKKTK